MLKPLRWLQSKTGSPGIARLASPLVGPFYYPDCLDVQELTWRIRTFETMNAYMLTGAALCMGAALLATPKVFALLVVQPWLVDMITTRRTWLLLQPLTRSQQAQLEGYCERSPAACAFVERVRAVRPLLANDWRHAKELAGPGWLSRWRMRAAEQSQPAPQEPCEQSVDGDVASETVILPEAAVPLADASGPELATEPDPPAAIPAFVVTEEMVRPYLPEPARWKLYTAMAPCAGVDSVLVAQRDDGQNLVFADEGELIRFYHVKAGQSALTPSKVLARFHKGVQPCNPDVLLAGLLKLQPRIEQALQA